MIGTCECCDRQNVPISHIDTVFGIEAFACYLCCGENDPDPYNELVQATEWKERAEHAEAVLAEQDQRRTSPVSSQDQP